MNAVVLDTCALIEFLERRGRLAESLRSFDRLVVPAAVDAETMTSVPPSRMGHTASRWMSRRPFQRWFLIQSTRRGSSRCSSGQSVMGRASWKGRAQEKMLRPPLLGGGRSAERP